MKKYIAPIIITIIVLMVLASYALGIRFMLVNSPGAGFVIALLIMLGATGIGIALIVTLVKRIQEIRKEDEDDYRKY